MRRSLWVILFFFYYEFIWSFVKIKSVFFSFDSQ